MNNMNDNTNTNTNYNNVVNTKDQPKGIVFNN